MDSMAIQKHELPPTNQKRMVAFINHFVVSTATFLNQFASDCENRLILIDHKLQNMEASLMILEAKLASIDVLQNASNNVTTAHLEPIASDPSSSDTVLATEETKPATNAKADPQYDHYFKMLHLGVPLGAVKNKITAEGLNPNYIDQFL
ncbi:WASH complex subunit 3 [Anopheles bellator]|uniref:WASH complex subunit 3 n=1 Tax=Anopheles bellator TaxID=139047 RepID=UPI002648B5C5|nr:WASH complex subunit 3 [Anopheles bellator]